MTFAAILWLVVGAGVLVWVARITGFADRLYKWISKR